METLLAILAITGFATSAVQSGILTALAWLLSLASTRAFRTEQRLAALEATVQQLRKDLDEVDAVQDKFLDVAGVSRNGVLKSEERV